MRPRPSAQAPAEYHADGARHKRQTYSFRAHGRIADRIFAKMAPIGLPNTASARCRPPSKACTTMPTNGIAGLTVLPTGVLQQLAYHLKRPFGVSRSPEM